MNNYEFVRIKKSSMEEYDCTDQLMSCKYDEIDVSLTLSSPGSCKYSFRVEPSTVMATTTLRGLLNELRLASPNGRLENSLAAKYIIAQFRKYKTTDQQLCKAREEMHFLGKTYLCYLKSLRTQAEISKEYHGRGERTVKETADLVGFKLPTDPK
ncbi:protein FMC1 homolog [Hermetia illucens]|uniref:protein FMC1 homolog n=1 Tax=Hermetia illucens TaxID=343691 RepID=UPI0018CC5568|nr:protein FMC1 homolog [Hermetia illucens]